MTDAATLLSELLKQKAILEQQEAIILPAQKLMMDAASMGRTDKFIEFTSTVGPKKENICFFTEARMREAPLAHMHVHRTVIQCITVLSKAEKLSIEEAATKLGCSEEITLMLKKYMEDNNGPL